MAKPKQRICPVAKVECKYLSCSDKRCARKTPPASFKRASKLEPSLHRKKK